MDAIEDVVGLSGRCLSEDYPAAPSRMIGHLLTQEMSQLAEGNLSCSQHTVLGRGFAPELRKTEEDDLGCWFQKSFQATGCLWTEWQVIQGWDKGCGGYGWTTLAAVVKFILMFRFDISVSWLNAVHEL
jgi:hypothetical protein